MIGRGFSVLFYVVAVMFLYTAGITGFLRTDEAATKLAVLAGFAGAGGLALLLGFACVRFRTWRRDGAIVLLVSAAVDATAVASLISMLYTPELAAQMPAGTLDRMNDYLTGGISIASLAVAGGLLLWSSRIQALREASERHAAASAALGSSV